MKKDKYSLAGIDGNAFSILGYVEKAMDECGFSDDEKADYREKAMSGDYYNLLAVSQDMIKECNKRCAA